MDATDKEKIKQQVIEILEAVESATKRNVLDSTLKRIKRISAERILHIIEGNIDEFIKNIGKK